MYHKNRFVLLIFLLIACVVAPVRAGADSATTQKRIGVLQTEISALIDGRTAFLEAFARGEVCSGCGRTKADIEAHGEKFPHPGQHVVVPTAEQVAAKGHEYNQNIITKQAEVSRLIEQFKQELETEARLQREAERVRLQQQEQERIKAQKLVDEERARRTKAEETARQRRAQLALEESRRLREWRQRIAAEHGVTKSDENIKRLMDSKAYVIAHVKDKECDSALRALAQQLGYTGFKNVVGADKLIDIMVNQKEWTPAKGASDAITRADAGAFVVGTLSSKDTGSRGHVFVVMPGSTYSPGWAKMKVFEARHAQYGPKDNTGNWAISAKKGDQAKVKFFVLRQQSAK